MENSASFGNPPGLWVAVFGPDGAGKSAAIQQLAQQLSLSFRGVESFHFRPRLGRRSRDSPPVTDPHGKAPRSFLVSLFKLFYWLADCWYGYVVAIRPALDNSSLIVFDRYFPDVLVDPVRYRLPASTPWFAKFIAGLVPAPDLYILLDVPAEVLQQRKPEVTCQESRRQRLAYLKMFQSLPNAVVVDAAGPLDEITRQMKAIILNVLAGRTQNPSEVTLIASS